MIFSIFSLSLYAAVASAHITAWSKGMYCKNGLSPKDEPNAAYPMLPLVSMTYDEWFMHGQCRNYPPPKGEFLDLPANGQFTVELSAMRSFTSLSFNGNKYTGWADGGKHPANYSVYNTGGLNLSSTGCISMPNLHAHGQWDAAGTVFAIAYKSDINQVKMSDLVIFSVAPNTPYMVRTTYQVPNLPACPKEGCICAWGWVPNHCGQSNVYMNGYRCRVTGASPTAKKLATPVPPVWCEDDPSRCVVGAKQMVIYWMKQGNTIDLYWFGKNGQPGIQKDGQWASPGYNMKMGFKPGAQTDIWTQAKPANYTALQIAWRAPKAAAAVTTATIATSSTATRPVTAAAAISTTASTSRAATALGSGAAQAALIAGTSPRITPRERQDDI